MNNNETWAMAVYRGITYSDYDVSSMGNVRSNKFNKQKILKPKTNNNGYLFVALFENNKPKDCLVHRLVLESFKGCSVQELDCCHYPDPDKTNNNLDNLCWGSRKQNLSHAVKQGTMKKIHLRKFSDEQAVCIRIKLMAGETLQSLAKEFKVSKGTIFKIKHNKAYFTSEN